MQLSVPEPCHEDWGKMTPQDQGRFCDACQKCVVDFSFMTDKELEQYLLFNPASVCGRFDSTQLQRILEVEKPYTNKVVFYKWAVGVALLLGLSKPLSGQTSAALAPIEWVEQDKNPLPDIINMSVFDEPVPADATVQYIKFNVIKKNSNKPYKGIVTVKLYYNNGVQTYYVECDALGNTELKIVKPFDGNKLLRFTIEDVKDNQASVSIDLEAVNLNPALTTYMHDQNSKGISARVKLELPSYKKAARRRAWNKLKFWKKKKRMVYGRWASRNLADSFPSF